MGLFGNFFKKKEPEDLRELSQTLLAEAAKLIELGERDWAKERKLINRLDAHIGKLQQELEAAQKRWVDHRGHDADAAAQDVAEAQRLEKETNELSEEIGQVHDAITSIYNHQTDRLRASQEATDEHFREMSKMVDERARELDATIDVLSEGRGHGSSGTKAYYEMLKKMNEEEGR